MRIIDADELKALRELYIQGKLQFIENEYDLIDKCPTIDAEPVRHGQWVRNDCGETYCSECHNRIPYIRCYDFYPDCCMDDEDMQWDEEIERTTYCPNCGAKMDLKE